jgi:hypothetical protein
MRSYTEFLNGTFLKNVHLENLERDEIKVDLSEMGCENWR